MTNPFDDDSIRFHVLINDEGQHCIWPTFAEIPTGWNAVVINESREASLKYVEESWADMRPASLVRAVEGDGR